ncbi:hypothetical protein D0C36_22945 [Mucilaginibacter conchicola]|uniref:Uncharacterized protein n=1 Tax=Mucilaginibacter conchicola TaxID=2303333 RepID=A0A372NMB4_9SPHI|nr:hypothetical protein [Mucilaginibacter conchicola]RFZ90102.1 hypothetical protein D0C36_22945 [Mucilaginibacter conchicola]
MKNLSISPKYLCRLLAVTFIFFSLSIAQLHAQHPPGRPIFIIQTPDGNDTSRSIFDAGKRWFDVYRMPGSNAENLLKYQSAKFNEDGTSVLVTFQTTTVNRAGIGGALKPKKETAITTDPTSIVVEYVGGYAEVNQGGGTTTENSSTSKKKHAVYENHAEGSYSTANGSRLKVVPTLDYTNADQDGRNVIKFDSEDGPMNFVDRKLNITTFPKSIKQITRAAEALRQNPKATLRYEVPKNRVAKMQDLLKRAGEANNPRIKVVGVDYTNYPVQ